MTKIPCGGFELGEGLEMEGRTLKVSGGSSGSSGVMMINAIVDRFTHKIIGVDKTYDEITEAMDNGMLPVVKYSQKVFYYNGTDSIYVNGVYYDGYLFVNSNFYGAGEQEKPTGIHYNRLVITEDNLVATKEFNSDF